MINLYMLIVATFTCSMMAGYLFKSKEIWVAWYFVSFSIFGAISILGHISGVAL